MKDKKNKVNDDIFSLEIKDTGVIKEIKKGIVKITGLPSCSNGQMLELGLDLLGLVIGFNKNEVHALVLGDETKLRIGDVVYGDEDSFDIPVGNEFIGRVVNSFGQPLDGLGDITENDFYPIFRDAPGVMDRDPIEESLLTGIKIIDTVIPIGKGQRELILGDRVTGKTTLAVDTILNQKGKDVVCIFCFIGISSSSFLKSVQELVRGGAMDYTIIVRALASSSPGEQYVSPYAACALGEYFMYQGRDVLVVFDNLTRHAWVYRELSLLLERSPGREAYPGDMFYLHSQLIERAAKLNAELGGGSMTFLPISETLEGDVTGLIPSNLISMTDGQIYLNTTLFKEGFKPAIELGLSVSRIGSKVQCSAIKKVSQLLKVENARYKELASLTRMRTKLSEEVEAKIKKGQALRALFIQDKNKPLPIEEIIVLFYSFYIELPQIMENSLREKFIREIYRWLIKYKPQLVEKIASDKDLSQDLKERLNEAFEIFFSKEQKFVEKI